MIRRSNIWEDIDWITVLIYSILVIMGWCNIYAAVYNEDHQSILDISQRYGKQMIWIGATIIMLISVLLIESKFYAFFAYPIYGFVIIMLLTVLIFGKEVHGARSWFEIGGLRLQPAEFAKFATALAVAKYIGSYGVKVNSFKTLVRVGLLLAIPSGLILLQNDTGSAVVYVIFALVMFREGLHSSHLILAILAGLLFFVSLILNQAYVVIGLVVISLGIFYYFRNNIKEILIVSFILTGTSIFIFYALQLIHFKIDLHTVIYISIIICTPVFAILAYKFRIYFVFYILIFLLVSSSLGYSVEYVFNNVLENHQQRRINDLLGIEFDPLGSGYNVNQSKIAIGSGGFFGKGFLNGTQTKYNFVPEQDTDFIFCTVGEEWGFFGSFVVIGLFMGLLLRLIFLAERQRSTFSRAYGYCVIGLLFFHLAVNIGMTIGLTPVIGIPLPFFSYGGSSLWAFTILLFVFLKLDSNRLELIG